LPGAVSGRMVEAASTMITPPLNPATNRQPKNQMNDTGAEQAKAQRQASAIVPRSA